MDALTIDGFAFCRRGELREGEFKVAELARLAGEATDGSGALGWSVQGGNDQHGNPKLELSVSGSVRLMCQRCLTPYAFDIDSQSTLILAKDEESVDALEELLDDDTVDVIAGNRVFGIAELIEDEALLALPTSPRHEVCPDAISLQALKNDGEKLSPFAVLKNIKPSR
jgi:uncharacterized protein